MPNPLALEQAQRQLETDLKAAIARHADGKAHELDLSFGERGTPSVGALSDLHDGVELEVYRLIDAFHEDPVVEDAGLHVGHVTAIDSDGDGEASLSVRYVYQDDEDADDDDDTDALDDALSLDGMEDAIADDTDLNDGGDRDDDSALDPDSDASAGRAMMRDDQTATRPDGSEGDDARASSV